MPSLLSLLLTTLFALVAAPLTNCLAAQDTNTLRAYPVAPGRAAEAQRMLTELAGPDATHANITVNDATPQGLLTKLGTQDQSKTDFSPNVLNYNHLARFEYYFQELNARFF